MFVTMVVSLYTARVFLNVLGASDYGLYQLVAGTVALFGFLQDTLVLATLRYLCYYKGKNDSEKVNTVFNISILLHFILSLIITCFLLGFANFLFDGFLNIPPDRIEVSKVIYYLMVVTSFLTIMSIPYDSVLNANENMLYFSIIGIIEALLKLVLALLIEGILMDNLIFFGFGTAFISLLSLAIRRFYCHVKYKECRYNLMTIDIGLLKDMLKYAGWNMLTGVSVLFISNATGIVLNKFFGTIVNAAQGIATQVNGVLFQFSGNIQKSINPIINKSFGENNEIRMLKLSFSGSKLSFSIFFIFCIPMIVESPYILRLWLKNVPDWTVIFCQILLIRTLTHQLTSYFTNCIYATGLIRNYCILKSIFNLLSLGAMIIAFLFGMPPYYSHIALFVFFEFAGGIIILSYCHKLFNFSIYSFIKILLFPGILLISFELVTGFVITTLMEESLIRVVLNILLIVWTFALLSWFFFFNDEERNIILSFKQKVTARININI